MFDSAQLRESLPQPAQVDFKGDIK